MTRNEKSSYSLELNLKVFQFNSNLLFPFHFPPHTESQVWELQRSSICSNASLPATSVQITWGCCLNIDSDSIACTRFGFLHFQQVSRPIHHILTSSEFPWTVLPFIPILFLILFLRSVSLQLSPFNPGSKHFKVESLLLLKDL